MSQAKLTLDEAARILKESGARIRMRPVKGYEYVFRCPNPRCQYHKLATAMKDPVRDRLVVNAAGHIRSEANKKAKRQQLRKIEELVDGGDKN